MNNGLNKAWTLMYNWKELKYITWNWIFLVTNYNICGEIDVICFNPQMFAIITN